MKYTEEDLTLAQFIAKHRVLYAFLPDTETRTRNEYVADMLTEQIIHPMQGDFKVRLDNMYGDLNTQYQRGYDDGFEDAQYEGWNS